ncbi:acyl-CoA synthetase, putative, partial [Ixodes scapularis]
DLSKLSYFHAPGKEPLLPWTVGELIDRAADSTGDTTAIVSTHQNISKTYTQYRGDVDQLAAGLVSLKLPVGSKVAFLSPRLYQGAQLLYAASKAGLVMVGIHAHCTLHELEICLNKRETICLNADLIYGFGRTIGVLSATIFGSTVVMPGTVFAPKVVLEAIEKHRCTTVYGSPSMFSNILRELEEGSYDVSSVRKGLVSGSLCPPGIVEKAKAKLNVQRFYIMYGSAECSPIFSSTNPDEPTDRWIKTVGTPLDHVEVKVVDAQGRIVPVNTKGELCTRGPHVFKGYLNDDAMTKEAIRDNWYHTGDEGTISEEGRITFLGRIKEVIAHVGVNVSPLEIENLLNTHPDVEEAQVIGVPDESVGENICAWIKLKTEKTLTQEDIQAFCEGKLHSFKIPKFVLFVDTFPRTQTGKVQKHKMREESKRLLNL